MPKLNPILLATDDADYVLRIRKAFADLHTPNPLQVVGDGEATIQYLAGEGQFNDRSAFPFPALLLLDLKLPVLDGLEVLGWMSRQTNLPRKLPVVVLSSTELPEETQQAYAMNIQACLLKPLAYSELRERIRILKEYWLDDEGTVI